MAVARIQPSKGRGEVSVRDAADLLKCHPQTVRNYLDAGLLKARRPLGRGNGKPTWLKLSAVVRLRDKLAAESK